MRKILSVLDTFKESEVATTYTVDDALDHFFFYRSVRILLKTNQIFVQIFPQSQGSS